MRAIIGRVGLARQLVVVMVAIGSVRPAGQMNTHVEHVLAALHVSNRVQVVRFAVTNGLV